MRAKATWLIPTLAALVWMGCSEDPAPVPLGGAGLRVQLPDEAAGMGLLSIELWETDSPADPPQLYCWARDGLARTAPRPGVVPAGELAQDPIDCGAWEVEIFDLLGNLVRTETVETGPGAAGRAWDWRDAVGEELVPALDDRGEPVPGGIYPTQQRCTVDPLSFSGHYVIIREEAEFTCDWMIWSATVDPAETLSPAFSPFPVDFDILTYLIDDEDKVRTVTAFFRNPYLLRVRDAGGVVRYQSPVELVNEEFVTVPVTFPPVETQQPR